MEDQYIEQAKALIQRASLWSKSIEKLLRKWRNQICIRQRGHAKLERKYLKRDAMISLPNILLQAAVTIGIFTTFQNCDTSKEDCEASTAIRLTSGFVLFASTCVSGMITFFDYKGLAAKHKSSIDNYNELINLIDSTLSTPVVMRGDPVGLLQNIKSQYDDIVKQSDSIPEAYQVALDYKVAQSSGGSSSKSDNPPPPHIDIKVVGECDSDCECDSHKSEPLNVNRDTISHNSNIIPKAQSMPQLISIKGDSNEIRKSAFLNVPRRKGRPATPKEEIDSDSNCEIEFDIDGMRPEDTQAQLSINQLRDDSVLRQLNFELERLHNT